MTTRNHATHGHDPEHARHPHDDPRAGSTPGTREPPSDYKPTLEALTRRLAKTSWQDGKLSLVTDGDPALLEAFALLGWAEPYVLPPPPAAKEPEPEPAATGATTGPAHTSHGGTGHAGAVSSND